MALSFQPNPGYITSNPVVFTGATIACRDMEGVGETVKMAGGLAFMDFEQAIAGLKELVLNPKFRNEMSERAVMYAEEFSSHQM